MHQNLVVFNSESAYYFFKDKHFRQCVVSSDNAICDSVSLSIVLRLIRVKHRRLHGPDLFESYLKANPDKKIVILGGPERAHRSIKKKYQLKAPLFISDKIVPENIDSESKLVKQFDPSAIFVCLGLRKQEKFIHHLLQLTEESGRLEIIAGVGAAVDFAGDSKKRAGRVFRFLGLEWLPRLVREPRMFPRLARSVLGCFLVLLNAQFFKKEMDKFLVSLDV